MNLYVVLASTIGTGDAMVLGARLSAWHDAMVAHERALRMGARTAACDDECPHADASMLWNEALETLGERAHELAFLRARAARTMAERVTSNAAGGHSARTR